MIVDNDSSSPREAVVLPGYEAQPDESGVDHSKKKLAGAAQFLQEWLPSNLQIETIPCEKEEDSWAYRCRCTFQIVTDEDGFFHYAMRHKKEPVILGSDSFPIATNRIQRAMNDLIKLVLNCSSKHDFPEMKRNLTSATFASSWCDVPESDCVVTLYYEQPLDAELWQREATQACDLLKLRQLNGRSKKLLVSGADDSIQSIRDTVWIYRSSEESSSWDVSLTKPSSVAAAIPIYYQKPETAFYHPNARAMTKALQWMLNRLNTICPELDHPCRLLEMYCGCGAHTVALGRTGLLETIEAVELDQRLVDACSVNIQRNELQGVVRVTQRDAGEWAKRFQKKQQTEKYDILLVDPPRMGLDEQVCNMARQGGFEHFLYISCGHKALLRDLERLSSDFEVVHCAQMDLFPRTDSIETLVHLRRIRMDENLS
jgi:tRNA/tmRNA/rRNA uracil-C5-methylase (TrmA/RlmC/RlmD family)